MPPAAREVSLEHHGLADARKLFEELLPRFRGKQRAERRDDLLPLLVRAVALAELEDILCAEHGDLPEGGGGVSEDTINHEV